MPFRWASNRTRVWAGQSARQSVAPPDSVPGTTRPLPLTAATRTSLPPVTRTAIPRPGRRSTRAAGADLVTTDRPRGVVPVSEVNVRLPVVMVTMAQPRPAPQPRQQPAR